MHSSTAKAVQSLDLHKRGLSALSQESMYPQGDHALSSAHAPKLLNKWSQAHLRTWSDLSPGFDFSGVATCRRQNVWTDLGCVGRGVYTHVCRQLSRVDRSGGGEMAHNSKGPRLFRMVSRCIHESRSFNIVL